LLAGISSAKPWCAGVYRVSSGRRGHLSKTISNPRTSQIRHLHILITSGGHVYDLQQQCDEIMEYNNKTSSMVEAATNLRLLYLDLCAFTPLDSIPTLQPSLQAANNLLVSYRNDSGSGILDVAAQPAAPTMNRSSNLQPTRQYFQLYAHSRQRGKATIIVSIDRASFILCNSHGT
jgi:hypothetical protein